MPDISEGLSTGGQPSVDQMLADKVERTRSRNEQLDDPMDAMTRDELHRALLAPEGIRAGLEELRDPAPGEREYEAFVNSPELHQLAVDEARAAGNDNELQMRRDYDDGHNLGLTASGIDYDAYATHEEWQAQVAEEWATASPAVRQNAVEIYELPEHVVEELDNLAQTYRANLSVENAQLRDQVSRSEQLNAAQRVLAEYGVKDPEAAHAKLLSVRNEWNATPGLPPFESYTPAQLAENLRLSLEHEKAWAKAEKDAAEKRAIFGADLPLVAEGLEVLGANGWQRTTQTPNIQPRVDFAQIAAAAKAKANSGQQTVAGMKAELLADDAMSSEYKALQRKATETRGAALEAEKLRERALRGQVVGTRPFVPSHAR